MNFLKYLLKQFFIIDRLLPLHVLCVCIVKIYFLVHGVINICWGCIIGTRTLLSTVALCVCNLWIMLWIWLATQRADGELGQVDSHHLLLIYIICKNVSKEKEKNKCTESFSVVVDGKARPFWDNYISTWITSLNQHFSSMSTLSVCFLSVILMYTALLLLFLFRIWSVPKNLRKCVDS